MEVPDPIDIVNLRIIEDFSRQYLPDFDVSKNPPTTTFTSPKSHKKYTITLQSSHQVTPTDFTECFELIRESSMEDYQKSERGWNPVTKKAEMRLDDLKYLIVKDCDDDDGDGDGDGEVMGFTSFMPTYEDSWAVVYVYEIHLREGAQGTGLGTHLMNQITTMAAKIPSVSKIMLTCYTRNTRAMNFYTKLGFEKDDYSPPPRVLRNGTKVEASYMILSKKVP